MTEVWTAIPSFPKYQASSDGRVRRLSDGRLCSLYRRKDGYITVTINRAPKYVHRLVCEAFNGAPFEAACAAHADGNRSNNAACNLRWATHAENEADKLLHGTRLLGSKTPGAKLNETQVISIRAAYRMRMATQTELARLFGVGQTKISDVVNYRTWRHVE